MSLVTDRLNGVVGDLFGKAPCRTVSTTNITLSGLQAFGGVTQIEGDRHLATGQTDQSENGIYNASTGSWTRTALPCGALTEWPSKLFTDFSSTRSFSDATANGDRS